MLTPTQHAEEQSDTSARDPLAIKRSAALVFRAPTNCRVGGANVGRPACSCCLTATRCHQLAAERFAAEFSDKCELWRINSMNSHLAWASISASLRDQSERLLMPPFYKGFPRTFLLAALVMTGLGTDRISGRPWLRASAAAGRAALTMDVDLHPLRLADRSDGEITVKGRSVERQYRCIRAPRSPRCSAVDELFRGAAGASRPLQRDLLCQARHRRQRLQIRSWAYRWCGCRCRL